MGCCVVACELLGIELTGNDIDVMFGREDVETKSIWQLGEAKSYVEVHESKKGEN
jgi:hypothetical protein